MSASQHIEWLNLVEKTGPFLAVGVLEEAFPQGLEKVETRKRQRVRSAYEEWREAVDETDSQLDALHREWVRLVLEEVLEYEASVLKSGEAIPETLTYREPLSGAMVRPDFAVLSGDKVRLLIARYVPDSDLSAPIAGETWAASPIERMTNLCRATGVRVGLVTDGEQWTLVSVPADGSSSLGTWYARIWQQETVTLQAFVSLLEVRRCFGPAESNLDSLFLRSLEHQNEVTDTLGEQVRRAVEVLVQALDRADMDRDRQLLKDVTPAQLYEAGLTVMMRLVVLLCAEERKLLLLGEPIYDQHYAVSTLRARLREEKERLGDEVLERRHDAWSRLLAVFRVVFDGIEHETLRLPALGGSLFDPDRFPFLEGRATGTSWCDTFAIPLPIDNRTVLMLLTALQVLEQRTGALLLSYEALDVEQIGHVYEGLLERTVKRVPETTLGLIGSQKAINPNVPLRELEAEKSAGDGKLLAYLLEKTGRTESGLKSALAKKGNETLYHRVLLACGDDIPLADRIKPWSFLLRTDSWGDPLAYRENSFIVTRGAGRRETGTHYTPKSLTEPIVQHTLEPLVYVGQEEGKPEAEWQLKSPREILALKVCDMAMGSGAFLVQSCRWLGDRLVEAWDAAEKAGRAVSIEAEVLDQPGDAELLPRDQAERVLIARRLIASRCLYGVDRNPMAVELGKVSLWLVTMMKNRPFSFLDHALKCGDSLVGINQLKQLENFSIRDPDHAEPLLETANLWRHIEQATSLRRQLEVLPNHTAAQIAEKARLHVEAETQLAKLHAAADFLTAAELDSLGGGWDSRRAVAASQMQSAWKKEATEFQRLARLALNGRRPFHWPVEFPEVFAHGGFDAFVGNPPFIGNKYWQDRLFVGFQHWAEVLAGSRVGKIDVVALFFRRAFRLLKTNGKCGMLATTTAREGETLKVGFEWIHEHGEIFRAISQENWPGEAGVHYCVVWFGPQRTRISRFLDDSRVDEIFPSLTSSASSANPETLVNSVWGFKGSDNSKGEGFILRKADEWFHRLAEAKSPFLRPYLTGEDITSGTFLEPERYVVDCQDQSLDQVRALCPTTHEFLVSHAFSLRQPESLRPYPGLAARWWQMWNHRANYYKELRKAKTCLAIPVVAKHMDVAELPTSYVFTNKICLIRLPSRSVYCFLVSSCFEEWVREQGGTMRADTLTLTLEKCVQTIPDNFPLSPDSERMSALWNNAFGQASAQFGPGFTSIFNRFHDPDQSCAVIETLREARRELNRHVAGLIGIAEPESLQHGFHETKQGVRYTLNEPARRVVLDKLLELNHRCYAEEVKAGLHEKGGKKGKKGKESPDTSAALLL